MDKQELLFDIPPDWSKHWLGMPDYQADDQMYRDVIIHFRSEADVQEFAKLMNQPIGDTTKYLWFPKIQIEKVAQKRYMTDEIVEPRFPLYIVSKSRWDTRLTSDSLHEMGLRHYLVVEESQRDIYEAKAKASAKILTLDNYYQRQYNTFDELGDTKSKGPGPARNFAWDHAKANGFTHHWVMDDNINGFWRFHNNLKVKMRSGLFFRAQEDFVLRYENIWMAGPNYCKFAPRKTFVPPYIINTRIYSCNLIKNDIPFRWRGRYNEDTDLSLMILKAKMCTVQFNAFLQDKITTQLMKGGNTEAFYSSEGTLPKSQMLQTMHPDVTRVVFKFGRWHHHVNYRIFRDNKLKLNPNAPALESYNLTLREIERDETKIIRRTENTDGTNPGTLTPQRDTMSSESREAGAVYPNYDREGSGENCYSIDPDTDTYSIDET